MSENINIFDRGGRLLCNVDGKPVVNNTTFTVYMLNKKGLFENARCSASLVLFELVLAVTVANSSFNRTITALCICGRILR